MVEITLQLDEATAAEMQQRAKDQEKTIEQIATEQLKVANIKNGTSDASIATENSGKGKYVPKGAGKYDSGDPTLARRTRDVIREAVEKGEWP